MVVGDSGGGGGGVDSHSVCVDIAVFAAGLEEEVEGDKICFKKSAAAFTRPASHIFPEHLLSKCNPLFLRVTGSPPHRFRLRSVKRVPQLFRLKLVR
jgi:hypothetical protein